MAGNSAGPLTFVIAATDSFGESAYQTFTLYPSTGLGAVPNVVGQSRTTADATLTAAGFATGNVSSVYFQAPVDQVLTQFPAAGASVLKGEAIALQVSLGPQPVLVPLVVGQPLTVASTAVDSAGLHRGGEPGVLEYRSAQHRAGAVGGGGYVALADDGQPGHAHGLGRERAAPDREPLDRDGRADDHGKSDCVRCQRQPGDVAGVDLRDHAGAYALCWAIADDHRAQYRRRTGHAGCLPGNGHRCRQRTQRQCRFRRLAAAGGGGRDPRPSLCADGDGAGCDLRPEAAAGCGARCQQPAADAGGGAADGDAVAWRGYR